MKSDSTFPLVFKITTGLQLLLLLWAVSLLKGTEGLEGLAAALPLMGYMSLLGINFIGALAYVVLVIKKKMKLDVVLAICFALAIGSFVFYETIIGGALGVNDTPTSTGNCSAAIIEVGPDGTIVKRGDGC